jgi:hypothetical protein
MRVFLIDRVIQEKDSYVYNMHNIVEKQFSISIVPERSRAWSLVSQIAYLLKKRSNSK